MPSEAAVPAGVFTVPVTQHVDAAFDAETDINPCSADHWIPQPSTECTLRGAIAFCYKNVPWGMGNSSLLHRCVIKLDSTTYGPTIDLTYGAISHSMHAVPGNITIDLIGDGVVVTAKFGTNALSLIHDRDVIAGTQADSDGAHLTISNLKFSNSGDTVANDGGAVYLFGFASVQANYITFESNWGRLGGGLHAGNCTLVTVTDCVFSENQALAGAAAHFMNIKKLDISDSLFADGHATLVGGALSIDSCQSVSLVRSRLGRNIAGSHGGALAVHNVWGNVDLYNLTIAGNTGTYGSGVCLRQSQNVVLGNVTFASNTAFYGATMFWIRDEHLEESKMLPPVLNGENIFVDNVYGAAQRDILNISTEVVRIATVPTSHHLTDFVNEDSLRMHVSLSDFYGHKILLEVGHIQLSVKAKNARGCSYNSDRSHITGTSVATSLHAEASFDGFGVNCIPGGYLNMSVISDFSIAATNFPLYQMPSAAKQALFSAQRRSVEVLVPVTLRTCDMGEYYDFGDASSRSLCRVCQHGYSLQNNTDNTIISCSSCPVNSRECYSDRVVLDAGTWRYSKSSTKIFFCPLADGCPGGEKYGLQACAPGYTGPLCSTCDDTYVLTADRGSCQKCDEAVATISPQLLVPFALCFLLFLAALVYYCHRLHHHHMVMHQVHPLKTPSHETVIEMQERMQTQERWFELMMKYSSRIKIVLTTFQIVVLLPENLRMQRVPALIGSNLNELVSLMSWVNFDTIRAMPINCYRTWNYIDSMKTVTSVPIGITAVLILIYGTYIRYYEYHYRPSRMYPQDNLQAYFGQIPKVSPQSEQMFDEEVRLIRQSLFSRYMFIAVLCSYVAVPAVVINVLNMFVCVDLDPMRENPEVFLGGELSESLPAVPSSRYLHVDLSINCDSTEYYDGRRFAVIACVVYPVAFSMLYYNLFRRAQKLAQVVGDEDFLEGHVTKISAPIRFLFSEAYKPQFYHWEFVDIGKRLLFMVGLAFIETGTQLQIVWGLFFTTIFYKLQCHYQPYLTDSDNTWAEVGLAQIFCTLLCLLIYRAESFETDLQLYSAVDLLTVLANLLFVFLIIWGFTSTLMMLLWEKLKIAKCVRLNKPNHDKSRNKGSDTSASSSKGNNDNKSAAGSNTGHHQRVPIEDALGIISSNPSSQASFFVNNIINASVQKEVAKKCSLNVADTAENFLESDVVAEMTGKYRRLEQAEAYVRDAIDIAVHKRIFRQSRAQQKHQRMKGQRQRELAFMRSNFLQLYRGMQEPGNNLVDTIDFADPHLSLEAINSHKKHLEDSLTAAENVLARERAARQEALIGRGLPYNPLGNLGNVARIERTDTRYFKSDKWLPPEFSLEDNRMDRTILRLPEKVDYHEAKSYIKADFSKILPGFDAYDLSDDETEENSNDDVVSFEEQNEEGEKRGGDVGTDVDMYDMDSDNDEPTWVNTTVSVNAGNMSTYVDDGVEVSVEIEETRGAETTLHATTPITHTPIAVRPYAAGGAIRNTNTSVYPNNSIYTLSSDDDTDREVMHIRRSAAASKRGNFDISSSEGESESDEEELRGINTN